MKNFKQFLFEKWEMSFKFNDRTYDIFVNPSTKESNEVLSQGYDAFSFIIDFDLKKLYVWNRNVLHHDVINEEFIPEFPKFWDYIDGVELDRFFCGHCNDEYKEIESDTIQTDIQHDNNKNNKERILTNLNLLMNHPNMKFINRWMNENEIKSIIKNTIEYIESKNK